ncbi:hypothetical protein SLE2022_172010 [Rubroshorea leprosula]
MFRVVEQGSNALPSLHPSPDRQARKRVHRETQTEMAPQSRKIARPLPTPPPIPDDVTEDVLLRLPVKCLIRFRCVCKSWNALTRDSSFVNKHLAESVRNPKLTEERVLLSCCSRLNEYTFKTCSLYSLLNQPFTDPDAFDFIHPFWYFWGRNRIVGCCNGLICMTTDYGKVIVVNLGLREINKLPGYFPGVFGFGYDSSNNDYKVVCKDTYTSLRVYSLRTSSWRTHDYAFDLPDGGSNSAYVGGTLNWLVSCREQIVSIDLATETIMEVLQPDYGDGVKQGKLGFGVLEGCLCVVCDNSNQYADVWIMRQHGVRDSWTKMVSIRYPLNLKNSFPLYPLFISENGEILFQWHFTMTIYNTKENSFRAPLLPDFSPPACSVAARIYSETLVSPAAADWN